jgi:hypothetical protein
MSVHQENAGAEGGGGNPNVLGAFKGHTVVIMGLFDCNMEVCFVQLIFVLFCV